MTDWRRTLARLTSELRDEVQVHVRAARDLVGARFANDAPYGIAAYHGYGTASRWMVHGRALQASPLGASNIDDTSWRNLVRMYQRLETDPLPAAQIHLRVGDVSKVTTADDEGFFQCWITPPSVDETRHWYDVELELTAPRRPDSEPGRARARIRVPSPRSRFVLVSDVDDTVLQSNIGSLVRAVRTVLLSNARTRLPFPGVAAFYRALERGASGTEQNPVFYLSSSPWNLFDVLAEFLELQGLPAGPLLLRDWDATLDALGSSRLHGFKSANLRELLALYPTLPFILVGDTTQQDPEIYSRIVHDHPGRILAVYIRDVTRTPERSAAVRALAEEVRKAHVPLVLADDTIGAARHAAEQGWIDPAALTEIGIDAQKDEGTRPGKAPA